MELDTHSLPVVSRLLTPPPPYLPSPVKGITDCIDVRIYRKPQRTKGDTFAVAEYRNAKSATGSNNNKKKKKTAAAATDQDGDSTVIVAGELLPGSMEDHVEHWYSFFDVVQSYPRWFRYWVAVHRRIGWRCKVERSLLNVMDARLLGFVTIRISGFA